jgi:hypothetical protein
MVNYHLYTAVFFKTLHLQSSFAGTTISCLMGKQLQEVQKSVSWLRDLWYSQGHAELDQCMVFRCLVVMVTGKVKLGNHCGDSHALTIQCVRIGDPLHTYNTTLPLGNVGEYTMLFHLSYIHNP